MKKIFQFGEKVDGYNVPVLNEREVRAAAGILFFGALSSFFYAFLLGDFYPTKIFVTIFMVDFIIRVLINPSYSPSMILGRLITSNQEVEYVGAPQKRFARGLGLFLSLVMFTMIAVFNIVSPANLIVCSLCIVFLFFESAFGICLGCMMYNTFSKNTAQLCPGGSCEAKRKEPIQYVYISHVVVIIGFILFAFSIPYRINSSSVKAIGGDDCIVPEWASAIGHDEMWLEHHGCSKDVGEIEREEEKEAIQADLIYNENTINAEKKSYDPNDPCQNIPEGHPADMWLIHNGCL